MRALLAVLVLLVTPAAAQAAVCRQPTGVPGWAPDVAAARAYAATRSHDLVSFSVRTGTRAWHHRPDAAARAASVAKAVLLVAELQRLRDVALEPGHRRELSAMVRRSDNIAATRVRDRVGDAAFGRWARAAGMARFRVDPVWGASTLTARDGARLFQRIERLLPPRHRAYGMRLLGTVVPSQRWGLGAVALPAGWTLWFKGGWGSGVGAVNHQAALLVKGCLRLSLAILTTNAPSHRYGTVTLREVAARLLRGLPAG